MALTVVRVLVAAAGALLLLAGLGMATLGGAAGGLFAALFLVVPGVVLLLVVVLERMRYRSLHHEQTGDWSGPGGGEPHPPEPRFRPTQERFVDPTTGVPMRVWIDPATGDRRYVPEV